MQFEASQRKCSACGETGHNARTCKSKIVPFSTGGYWKEKTFDGLEQLGLPLVDGTHVAMISKIVDGEVLKESNSKVRIPNITWKEEPITMTWGELDEKCKTQNLVSIGESTYSGAYLRGALAYLPKNTVLTLYTGYHYPLKATFEYGGEEWIFFLAPRVENYYAETITRTSYACSDCGREHQQERDADECCFAGCPHTWEMDKTTDWGDGMFTMNVSCRKCGAKSYIEGHADENSDSNPTPKFNAESFNADVKMDDRAWVAYYEYDFMNVRPENPENITGDSKMVSFRDYRKELYGVYLTTHEAKKAFNLLKGSLLGHGDWKDGQYQQVINGYKQIFGGKKTIPMQMKFEYIPIRRFGYDTAMHTKTKNAESLDMKNAQGSNMEYECQVCGKPADYNFQDATIRWDIINDEFSGSPKVSEYAGQEQNDFYCQEHADKIETSDFFAEYDFQNQAITTIIADEEDEAYEIFARTYDPTTEDWEVIDVREGEGSNMNENVLTIAIDISGSTGSQMLSPQGLVEREISLNHYYRKMAISAIMSMKPDQVYIVPFHSIIEDGGGWDDWRDAVKWLKDDKNLKPMGGTLPLNKVLQELNQMQERMEKSSMPPQYLTFSTMILTDLKPLTYGFSAESLKFKEWVDQEMMTHGGRESFQDWLDDEVSSHGNTSLEDWGEHEIASHEARYEAENVLSMKNLGAVAVGGALGIALVGLFTGKNLLTDMTSKLSKASEAKKDCHSCNTNGSVRKNQTQVLSSEYSVGQINPVEVEGQQDIHGAEGVNNPRFAPSPSPAPHRAKSSKWL